MEQATKVPDKTDSKVGEMKLTTKRTMNTKQEPERQDGISRGGAETISDINHR